MVSRERAGPAERNLTNFECAEAIRQLETLASQESLAARVVGAFPPGEGLGAKYPWHPPELAVSDSNTGLV